MAFNSIIARSRATGEYGTTMAALGFVNMLGLPVQMVATALTHYMAHFRGQNDEARLQGLLGGCRNFLLKITAAGSILAILLGRPLGQFFGFERPTVLYAVVACVLMGLWSGFAVAICQGMAWFKRLAVVAFVAMLMRLLYGVVVVGIYKCNQSEIAITATTFSLLANLILLYWWKSIFTKGIVQISPWNREFVGFLLVTAAVVGGNYFLIYGDGVVAKRYFGGHDLDWYNAAATLGRAIPATVGPLLLVMFTSRSHSKEAHAVNDQRVLLGFYAVGLACGALGLVLLRRFCVRILVGAYNEPAAHMVIPFSISMVLLSLNQAIGMWSLANRWRGMAILYGVVSFCYWLALLLTGRTPSALLLAMPIGAGLSFCILCACWLAGRFRKA
jgi:hypothetical protein